MARIRSIKPEFFDDERLTTISRDARLTYIGMWIFSDDYAVVRANLAWLNSHIYPYENIPVHNFKRWLDELIDLKRIIPFTYEDELYFYLPKFKKHQKIDKFSPVRNIPIDDYSTIIRRLIDEASTNDQRQVNARTDTDTDRDQDKERDTDTDTDRELRGEGESEKSAESALPSFQENISVYTALPNKTKAHLMLIERFDRKPNSELTAMELVKSLNAELIIHWCKVYDFKLTKKEIGGPGWLLRALRSQLTEHPWATPADYEAAREQAKKRK